MNHPEDADSITEVNLEWKPVSTFLITTLFKFSQAAVDFASTNKSLAVAIDEFEVKWLALKARKSTVGTP